jgi:hypothetical protein
MKKIDAGPKMRNLFAIAPFEWLLASAGLVGGYSGLKASIVA